MGEAIWLASSSFKKSSRLSLENWLDRFFAESMLKPEWVSTLHVIQQKPLNQPFLWQVPCVPTIWVGAAHQVHYLLGALCREVRAGELDLAMLLEKGPSTWNVSLIASPAFFGARNRIPAVAILETRAFNQVDPLRNQSDQGKYLKQFNLPDPLPPSANDSPAAWSQEQEWCSSSSLLTALNAAAAWLADRPGSKNAVRTASAGEPALLTILEGL